MGISPIALFGIDNDGGIGVAINLLVIFLIAVWFALVFWTYADARRRLQDSVLIGSATLAALIFPFAGALVYAIVRPPETLDEEYERELDVRAAELRVRLLEAAVKGGPGSSAHAATMAGELSGEPTGRRSAAPPSGGSKAPSGKSPSGQGGSPSQRRAEPTQQPSRRSSEPAPQRSSQPPRPSSGPGAPSRRPPAAGADNV